MIIDAGVGDKMDAKSVDIYAHRSHARTSITRWRTPG